MNIRLNEDEVVYISTPNPNDTIPYKQISLSTLLNNSNKNVDVFNKGIFFEIYFDIDEKGGLIGIEIYEREGLHYQIVQGKEKTRFNLIKKTLLFDGVECRSYCIYKNKNLIGMTLEELKNILNEYLNVKELEYYGPFLDSDEEWTEQIVNCDKFDAMFFFKNDIIESVAV